MKKFMVVYEIDGVQNANFFDQSDEAESFRLEVCRRVRGRVPDVGGADDGGIRDPGIRKGGDTKMDGNRQLQMHRIAVEMTEVVNRFVEDPITICYGRPSREIAGSAGMRRFTLVVGDEYFFIERGASTLYVVNVTADSYLTAIRELMDLIGRKF